MEIASQFVNQESRERLVDDKKKWTGDENTDSRHKNDLGRQDLVERQKKKRIQRQANLFLPMLVHAPHVREKRKDNQGKLNYVPMT